MGKSLQQIIKETINERQLLTEEKKWCYYGAEDNDGNYQCAATEEYAGDCKGRSVSGFCTKCACNNSNCSDCGDGGPAKTDPKATDDDLKSVDKKTQLKESQLLLEREPCCGKCRGGIQKVMADGKPWSSVEYYVNTTEDCKCCCARTGGWACGGSIPSQRMESYVIQEEQSCCDKCRGNVKAIFDNAPPDESFGIARSHVANNSDCGCCCAETGGWACGDIGQQHVGNPFTPRGNDDLLDNDIRRKSIDMEKRDINETMLLTESCACKDEGGHTVFNLCAGQDGSNNVQVLGGQWCCTNRIPIEEVCSEGCMESDSYCGSVKDKDDFDFKYSDEDSVDMETIRLPESKLINIIKRTINETKLLTEGPYCNPTGKPASSVKGCRSRGRGCLSDDGYFGTMGQNINDYNDWQCIPNELNVTPVDDDNPIDNDIRRKSMDMETIRLPESKLINIIKRVINEQNSSGPCSNNSMVCHGMIPGTTPNSGWISNMEALAASPGGCGKIVMKENDLSSKMNSKVGTQGCTGPNGEIVHSICNGQNPKWVAQLWAKLDWLNQSGSPFMRCATGECNNNTNDCN